MLGQIYLYTLVHGQFWYTGIPDTNIHVWFIFSIVTIYHISMYIVICISIIYVESILCKYIHEDQYLVDILLHYPDRKLYFKSLVLLSNTPLTHLVRCINTNVCWKTVYKSFDFTQLLPKDKFYGLKRPSLDLLHRFVNKLHN